MGGAGNTVGFKTLRWQSLQGSLAKRLAIRTLMFAVAISILPLMQFVYDLDPTKSFWSSNECDSDVGFLGPISFLGRALKPVTLIAFPHLRPELCKKNVNLTIDVAKELMSKKLLNYDAKALCLGQGSAEAVLAMHQMGFLDVDVIHRHAFFSLKYKQLICDLDFDDNSFGFVITRDIKKVSVPALLVNEVERILKPGGVAAILVDIEGSSGDSLIKSATSVSSFLKSSNVVHVASLGTITLVAFKKSGNQTGSYEEYHLRANCPSIKRNRPFINNMEPLVEKKPGGNNTRIAYLPSFVDVPSKGKLVYVDMGAKEAVNFSGTKWFLPSYPVNSNAFSVYVVDHDALVLSSHVKSPGVTFIYHPALAESVGKMTSTTADVEPFPAEEEFDFFVWFKETVEFADFVILKMNVGNAEMKFLSELFESGIICHIDELFLRCPESNRNGKGCTDVFKSLRKVGVFAHQWWGN